MSLFLEDDKQKHVWLSMLMCVVLAPPVYYTLRKFRPTHTNRAPLLATMITLVVGGMKEVTDALNLPVIGKCPCRAEVLDFVADLVGAVGGLLVVMVISRWWKRGSEAGGGGGELPLHGISKGNGL